MTGTWRRTADAWPETARLTAGALAVAVIAAAVAVQVVPAHWSAPGWPSFHQYPKNVEQAAVISAFAAAALAAVAWPTVLTRRLLLVPLLLAATSIVVIVGRRPEAYLHLLLLTLASTVYFSWFLAARDASHVPDHSLPGRWGWLLVPLCAAALFWSVQRPVGLSLHGQGEVIASALDLLHGGVPYRTFFWPHGLSDTGLVALLMHWTGNQGPSVLPLFLGLRLVMGLAALLIITCGLLRDRAVAVAVAVLLSVMVPNIPKTASLSLFVLLAFHLVSYHPGRWTIVAAGLSLGFAYLWRVDTGVYGFVAIVSYFLIVQYYQQGYAVDGRIVPHLLSKRRLGGLLGQLLPLMFGIALLLAFFRLAFGFPTVEWFRTTLLEIPAYHGDSTGVALDLPLKGFQRFADYGWMAMHVAVPFHLAGMLLLGLMVATKVRRRELPLSRPRDRFFLLLLLFSLLYVKTALDRSRPGNLATAMTFPLLLLLLDGADYLGRRHRRWPTFAGTLLGVYLLSMGLSVYYNGRRAGMTWLPAVRSMPSANLAALRHSLRPTVSWSDQLQEINDPDIALFREAVAGLRRELNERGIGESQFLVHHSGPLLYGLVDRWTPTKYYCLGWAATPHLEAELVSELQRQGVRAYLELNGRWGGLQDYDIPDSHRIPNVHRFLESERRRGTSVDTELGRLTIVPLPGGDGSAAAALRSGQREIR